MCSCIFSRTVRRNTWKSVPLLQIYFLNYTSATPLYHFPIKNRAMGSLADSSGKILEASVAKDKSQTYNFDVGLIQEKIVGGILGNSEVIPKLFTPLCIRGLCFQNRIMVSPMCMYSCQKQDGVFTDFHLGHLGNLALRGTSLVMTEATSVEPRGRLSPQDTGMWNDEQSASLKRIANLVHASGSKLAIQLAHGGRKAGTYPPYHNYEKSGGQLGRGMVPESEGGFPDELVAPSPIPWKKSFASPKELTIPEIKDLVQKWKEAAKRSVDAGVDVIEIHGAHGYLINEFLSGNTNKRTDEYGGSLENRLRFALEIITAVRSVMPKDMPLFLRVSGTDFVGEDILSPDPNGWDIEQVIELCKKAVPLGLDVIDVSSGANVPTAAKGVFGEFGFQVPLAEQVKKANIEGLYVASVGSLHNAKFAENVLQENKADIIFIGRQFIKDPSWVYTAAEELGVKSRWADQYSWMWPLK